MAPVQLSTLPQYHNQPAIQPRQLSTLLLYNPQQNAKLHTLSVPESEVKLPPGPLGTIAEYLPISGAVIEGLKYEHGEAGLGSVGVAALGLIPMGIGKGGVKVVEAFTSKDMALGLTKYLPDFKSVARTWRDFDMNPANIDFDKAFKPQDFINDAMHTTVNEGGKLRFNMQGVDSKSIFDVESEFYDSFTCQELRYIYGHRDLLANTVFYNEGIP